MWISNITTKIVDFSKKLWSKLPGLKFWRKKPKKVSREEIEAFSAKENPFVQTRKNVDKAKQDLTFNIAQKFRAGGIPVLMPLPDLEPEITKLENDTKQFIVKEEDEKLQKIHYNSDNLNKVFTSYIDKRELDYITRIENLNRQQLNADIKSVNQLAPYKVVFQDFFTESLSTLHNINAFILKRISENAMDASDLDLAEGFKQIRNISAVVAKKITQDFQILLDKLPSQSERIILENGETLKYSDLIKLDFAEPLKTLFQSSHFGCLSRKPVSDFIDHYIDIAKDDNRGFTFADLITLKGFQEAIHGSCLIKKNLSSNEIASLDQRITTEAIESLNVNILKHTHDREDRDKFGLRIKELRRFLFDTYLVENKVAAQVNNFMQDTNASKLGIEKEDILHICDRYGEINTTQRNVGEIAQEEVSDISPKGDKTNTIEFREQALINSLDLSNKQENSFERIYERLILETSLLAAYHALTDLKDEAGSAAKAFANFKNSSKYQNFENISWLKKLYDEEIQRFKKLIEEDQSSRKTVNIAVEMCRIARRLASPDVNLFQSNDFLKRYNLVDIANNALKRIGTFTDVNTMSFALKLYSELFSNLAKDPYAVGMSQDEVKWLKRHVEYLQDLSKITDDQGNILYAPPDKNPYETKKYKEISSYFRKPGNVSQNLDLILKYADKSFREAEDARKEQGRRKLTDSESRNLLLASALFYYYLKFIPDQARTQEQFIAKKRLIDFMFNSSIHTSKNLPKALEPKMLDVFLGTESDSKGVPYKAADFKQRGILRSYILDIKSEIEKHRDPKYKGIVHLHFLLHAYQRLEQIKKKSLQREEERNMHKTKVLEKDLGLWSKQELYHEKFFDQNEKLFPRFYKIVSEILPHRPKEVLSFALRSNDTGLRKFIARQLLARAGNTAKKGLKLRDSSNVVKIDTKNKGSIYNLTKLLDSLKAAGELLNMKNQAEFTINYGNLVGVPANKKEDFLGHIQAITDFLSSKFLLIDDPSVTNINRKDAIDKLNYLANKFKLKPAIGLNWKWYSPEEVSKYALAA